MLVLCVLLLALSIFETAALTTERIRQNYSTYAAVFAFFDTVYAFALTSLLFVVLIVFACKRKGSKFISGGTLLVLCVLWLGALFTVVNLRYGCDIVVVPEPTVDKRCFVRVAGVFFFAFSNEINGVVSQAGCLVNFNLIAALLASIISIFGFYREIAVK